MSGVNGVSMIDVVRSLYGHYGIGSNSRQVTADALSQNVSGSLVRTSSKAITTPIPENLQKLKYYVRGGIERVLTQRGAQVDLIS